MCLPGLTAIDIMSKTPKMVNENSLAITAKDILEEHSISQLIAVDEAGAYTGILHIHDLIKEGNYIMAKKQNTEEREMSFLDHLEELRWHLIRSTLAIVIIAVIAFVFREFIFQDIIFAPADPNFISYKFLCKISQLVGSDNGCMTEMNFEIQNRTMSGQFSAALWTSMITGFVLGFPYIIFEFWKFVAPGLHPNERNNSQRIYNRFLAFVFLGYTFWLLCNHSLID